MEFNQTQPITALIPEASGVWHTEIASNGDIAMETMTIGAVDVMGYNVLVTVAAPASTGSVNAAVPGYNASLNLTMRLRVTNAGTPAACVTPPFSAAFDGFYEGGLMGPPGQIYLYTASGGTGNAGWVTVPALPNSCAAAPVLNSLLGLGLPQQGLKIYRLRAVTPIGLTGS